MTSKFTTIQSKFNKASKRRHKMQSGTIVVRRAGTFIPNEYAALVLAAHPNGWGAATIAEGLQLNSSDEGMTLEFLQETQKAFPDQEITFYFAESADAISMTDIPPYILVVKKEGDEEIPMIVGFADGNFPSFNKVDSSHPAEYHLATDYLIPKLEGLYEMCDGDLDKVVEQLKKPYFKKELLLNSVSRGTITLVVANGTTITYSQSDRSAEYPWGWVSNNHGYAAGPPKEVKEPKVEKKSMFPSKSTVRERADSQPSSKIADAVKPPSSDASVIKNYTARKEGPPSHLSRSDRKDWYKVRIGYFPPAGEKSVAITCVYGPDNKLMTFSQIKALGLQAPPVLELLKNNPPRGKDVETENIPEIEAKKEAPQPKVTSEILPIMSPDTRKHIEGVMKDAKTQKIIAENADIIFDPAKVQSLEAKFASFSKQVGAESIDEFLKWNYEMLYDLGKTKPDGLAILANTFKNIICYHRTTKKAVEEVVEEVKPEKKSMFPKKSATG